MSTAIGCEKWNDNQKVQASHKRAAWYYLATEFKIKDLPVDIILQRSVNLVGERDVVEVIGCRASD